MSRFLFIDTATPNCHVGLGDEHQLLVQRQITEAFRHAELLTKLIEDCMTALGWAFSSLDAVAITGGPGSYTGLRIGASVAKGICFAINAKLIALNTLDVMANGFLLSNPTYEGWIVPMIDARRMEVFTAVYAHTREMWQTPGPMILDEQSFHELPQGDVTFIGDGAIKFEGILKRNATFDRSFFLGASAMHQLALDAFSLGKFESVAYYRPDYHKEFYSTIAK